jgi:PmbA protein
MHEVRRVDDLPIEDLIARHAQRARDTLRAELPASRLGPVVLAEGAFIPLLEPFRFATSGEAIYRKMSPLILGEPVLGDRTIRGDILHLTSDPTLAFGTASTPFDADGLALSRVPVIQSGEFSAVAASKRYADYLGMKPLGGWTNSVLEPGGLEATELLVGNGGSVFEIVEFSWLNPNTITGSFSTEIRLGYEHSPQGTRAIKGGSLSGNVYDAFAEVHMARDTELIGNYFGPTRLRFEALQVTGD